MISLNPCFNGRYSQSIFSNVNEGRTLGLNPCFNGRYSQSENPAQPAELGLNPCFNGRYSQRAMKNADNAADFAGLNPCFNGRYSQRAKTCVPLFIVV